VSQENVEIVRGLWNAAERRDDKAVYALYDPFVVWESGNVGQLQFAGGPYHGHDGVRQFFRDWLDAFGTYQAKAETFIEAGNRVVVGYRVKGRGKGSGVDVEMSRWNVYGIRNGLVNRVEVFITKAEALEAVGLSE
jgi:ketosteroid isomerase-like protein